MKYLKYNKQILTSACLALMIFSSSCKKFEDVGSPPTQLTADKIYADSTSILAASLALYGNYNVNGSGGLIVSTNEYGSASADDAFYPGNNVDFMTNQLSGSSNSTGPLYNAIYTMMLNDNTILQGLSHTTAISKGLVNQLTGEAKFWRAYMYFYLVSYYGDVPLVLNTDALTNAGLPRTPKAQVYQQIIQDLLDAKGLLTDEYPNGSNIRINKEAVSAFLARVYLFESTPNYSAAETEATNVLNSGLYSLDALSNVFLNTSTETIWQVESDHYSYTGVTNTGNAFLPVGTSARYLLYQSLANTFELNDQRKTNWAQPITYNGATHYYPYKYKLKNTSQSGNEYSVMLRLGEVYLNRAEARANQNNISGAQADLNVIRTRAGLPNTTASDQASLLTAIEHERWVELFTENSDRWFTLRRTGTIGSILPVTKSPDISNYTWSDYQALYPIPALQLQANPNLKQNPGY
jgi:hypothetical protein